MSSILANLKSRSQSVPKWSGRYSWGCKWSASLPVARIFPKPSKGFAKARPSTACDQRWHSRLTAFLAKGVFQIMLVVFPPGLTFNMLSVQQVIRTVWHSMMCYPTTEPTSIVNRILSASLTLFHMVAICRHLLSRRIYFRKDGENRGRNSLCSCRFATRTQLSEYFVAVAGLRHTIPGRCIWRTCLH